MKLKRIVISLLIMTMVTSCLAGCGDSKGKDGNKDANNSSTTIEMRVWNSGLGVEWLDAMIEAFEEEHPEYDVTYTASAVMSAIPASFGQEDIDTVDMYMGGISYDTTYMEPLDDLLAQTAEGDTKSLKEKFDASYLQLQTASDGSVYSLSYGGGVIGIVYNQELFKKAGIKQAPRTTDELAVVCNTLKSRGITPFCHYGATGYWPWLDDAWYGQYEGMDYYLNTFYGNPTKDTFLKKDGRYEILKAYEKFLKPEYVLSGSSSSDHTTMQTKFLSGAAAMMVNGSWLSNEMESTGQKMDNFIMMKLPVLSAITDKLTTVKSDTDLRKLIDAIDAVTDGEKEISEYKSGDAYQVDGKEVSADDWNYVYAARNTVSHNYGDNTAYIPKYSNAKEGAKEFLKFMYSDKGYQIYLKTLHLTLPMELSSGTVDKTDWNTFEQNQAYLMETGVQTFTMYNMGKHRIFVDGGASLFAGFTFINSFSSNNEDDRMNANEIWDTVQGLVNDNYEKNWLSNIK